MDGLLRRLAGAEHQQPVGWHLDQLLWQHQQPALIALGLAAASARQARRAARAASGVGVSAEPLCEVLDDLQLLGRKRDLDPTVDDDLLGQIGAVFGAQLGRALLHGQQAQAVARDIGEGVGEHAGVAQPGEFVEQHQHRDRMARLGRAFPGS